MPALLSSRVGARLLAVPLIALYAAARIRNPEYWDLLDDVNLAIHEAGHLFFQSFGDPIMTFAGSGFQVAVPIVFVASFVLRRQPFAASVVLAWVAVNLFNVSRYIGDARAQELPLLGGENAVHDWWFLLTEWDALASDRVIAGWVHLGGVICFLVSAAGALAFARANLTAGTRETPAVHAPEHRRPTA